MVGGERGSENKSGYVLPARILEALSVVCDVQSKKRDKLIALQILEDEVCHQGVAVGEYSADVLHRLVSIALDPTCDVRPDILRLVGRIRGAVGPWRRHYERQAARNKTRFSRMVAWEDSVRRQFAVDSVSLVALAEDQFPDVRGAAIDALSRSDMEDPDIVSYLLNRFRIEHVAHVVVDIVESIIRITMRVNGGGLSGEVERWISNIHLHGESWVVTALACSLLPYSSGAERSRLESVLAAASDEDFVILAQASWMYDRSLTWALARVAPR